jgi:hypothetical protein
MNLPTISSTALSDSATHSMHSGAAVRVRSRITCATLKRNTDASLQNVCEPISSHASNPTVGTLLIALSREAREAHESQRRDNARMQGRVHRIGVGIMTKLIDETGCPLSDDEITLMHRYGREPFSWEQ